MSPPAGTVRSPPKRGSLPPANPRRPLFRRLLQQCAAAGVAFLGVDATLGPRDSESGLPVFPLSQRFDAVVDALLGGQPPGFPGGEHENPGRPPYPSLLAALAPRAAPPPLACLECPSGWDADAGCRNPQPGAGLRPEVLISVCVPKLCARAFGGQAHLLAGERRVGTLLWLLLPSRRVLAVRSVCSVARPLVHDSGRHLPPAAHRRFSLVLPAFSGASQVMLLRQA